MPKYLTVASYTAEGAKGLLKVRTKTIVLLTPEEIDQAAKKTVKFRPPGS
jgi:hypothetical protein